MGFSTNISSTEHVSSKRANPKYYIVSYILIFYWCTQVELVLLVVLFAGRANRDLQPDWQQISWTVGSARVLPVGCSGPWGNRMERLEEKTVGTSALCQNSSAWTTSTAAPEASGSVRKHCGSFAYIHETRGTTQPRSAERWCHFH